MQYPQLGDYLAVMQYPAQAFTVPELRRAVLAKDQFKLPDPISGNSAVVFRATIDKKDYALRCYTRSDVSSKDRYAALAGFVAGTPALSTVVGTVQWHDHAVKAAGGTWPVLQMEWIDGAEIGDYVDQLAVNREGELLGSLADKWVTFVRELQRTEFAHGDLQHRNIIVDQRQQLRLVDFDGVWCPPLRGQPPPIEQGHDNFQPPGRTAAGRWGSRMDTFSALVIYLALTTLSRDPVIWDAVNDGDNLLFTKKDFKPPFATRVWDLLAQLSDRTVSRLAGRLQESCVPQGAGNKTLETLITPGWWEQQGTIPAPRTETRPARPRQPSGGTGPAPWYTQPNPVPPSGGPVSPPAGPARVPPRPAQPLGTGGKWWETSGQQPAGQRPAGQGAAPQATPGTAATGAAPGQRTPAKKEKVYPYRPLGLLLFIAGLITFLSLEAHHSAWEWAGLLLAAWGVSAFFNAKEK